MTKADVETLIGEPASESDLTYSLLKAQYLIDGNQIGIGAENVDLELMYRTSLFTPTNVDLSLVSMSIRQADN